ncbi:hypothetical protein GLV89_06780 [Halomonas alkaliantarctica]|nr:hypothetical protein [Halomonas alkaliantarctica]
MHKSLSLATLALATLALVFGLAGCATNTQETSSGAVSGNAEGSGNDAAMVVQEETSPRQDPAPGTGEATYTGPRKTLAVAKFDAHGAFVDEYGGADAVGGGLAAQLISALEKTDRFILVDRADLSKVLREQEMAMKGITTGGPEAGQILGAQMLVHGSVTEFTQGETGGGFSIGFGGGDIAGAIGPQTQTGHVTIDLRLMDTTTGQVLDTFTVEEEVSSSAVSADVLTDEGLSIGGNVFNKTPVGKATRKAIQRAVDRIVAASGDMPWRAQVAKVEGGKVYVNAGKNANLSRGDRLKLETVVEKITDPETGEVLGSEKRELGTVTLREIHDEYSVGVYQGRGQPSRGDILSLAETP